jgi:hypothetical protein
MDKMRKNKITGIPITVIPFASDLPNRTYPNQHLARKSFSVSVKTKDARKC